jgi:hypothetical protein
MVRSVSSLPHPLLVRKSGFCDVGSGDVLLQIAVQVVVRRHLVYLAALFGETHPAAPPLHEVVLDAHCNHVPMLAKV